MFDRRTILTSAPLGALLSASGASAANGSIQPAGLLMSDLFLRLNRPVVGWNMADLLWSLATFRDLNDAAPSGIVEGRDAVLDRLKRMRLAGDLNVLQTPGPDTVVVSGNYSTFSTALPPPADDGILAAYERPIIFSIQVSTSEFENDGRPFIIAMSVMRPFENSLAPAEPPCERYAAPEGEPVVD